MKPMFAVVQRNFANTFDVKQPQLFAEIGWRGDFIEAEAFDYLAVRSVKGLPLSLPSTTGVPHPMTGGRLYRP